MFLFNKKEKKLGDYEVINCGGDFYNIVGCSAGEIYGNYVVVKIIDLNGNSAYYLYDSMVKLYKKVDITIYPYNKYPCRYYGSQEYEKKRSFAYGDIFRKKTDENAFNIASNLIKENSR
ncbi:MAG TPA: hypothetical protein PLZ05_03130 [Alphaproteobacteria bacterium]|nr:hypothetical protein [Alphaproteobacteria bacterium]